MRPSLTPASTSIPITPTSSNHERRGRERAKTDSTRPATDRFPLPKVGHRHAPLHLDLASVGEKAFPSSKTKLPAVITHTPSAPIPIPPPRPKEPVDTPIAPFTARGDSARFMRLGRSLNPKYMTSPDTSRYVNYFSDRYVFRVLLRLRVLSRIISRRLLESGILTPSLIAPILQSAPRTRCIETGLLHLSHPPCHFHSCFPVDGIPHHIPLHYGYHVFIRPIMSRLLRAQPTLLEAHTRLVMDVNTQMLSNKSTNISVIWLQMPPEQVGVFGALTTVIATCLVKGLLTLNYSIARLTLSPRATASPLSPRLTPQLGSPGPVTPMALEEEVDYFRTTSSPSSMPSKGRDIV